MSCCNAANIACAVCRACCYCWLCSSVVWGRKKAVICAYQQSSIHGGPAFDCLPCLVCLCLCLCCSQLSVLALRRREGVEKKTLGVRASLVQCMRSRRNSSLFSHLSLLRLSPSTSTLAPPSKAPQKKFLSGSSPAVGGGRVARSIPTSLPYVTASFPQATFPTAQEKSLCSPSILSFGNPECHLAMPEEG